MIDLNNLFKQQQELAKKLAEQKELELKSLTLQKDKDALQSKFDALQSSIDKLQEKSNTQTNTPALASTPAPAKSMTLMHVGLLVGGIVIGYFAFKMIKK